MAGGPPALGFLGRVEFWQSFCLPCSHGWSTETPHRPPSCLHSPASVRHSYTDEGAANGVMGIEEISTDIAEKGCSCLELGGGHHNEAASRWHTRKKKYLVNSLLVTLMVI